MRSIPISFVSAGCNFPPSAIPGKQRQGYMKCPRRSQLTACAKQSQSEAVPLLEMRNMSYHVPFNLKLQVFKNMNFKIYEGEFIVVIGENGSGKSTALKMMIGFTRVQKGNGDLYWKGEKTRPSKMVKNIGMVMQNPGEYFVTPTVLDELILGRDSKTPDDVRRVLSAVGLNNISLMASPQSLSGGQSRRLAFASQLMREPLPPLFILDEPLAGVDWTARQEIVSLLASLKSQYAIVIVSHEPGDLLQHADRVVEVSRGGMHDIDPSIIERAIKVRAKRQAEKKAKAMEDARQYKAKTKP